GGVELFLRQVRERYAHQPIDLGGEDDAILERERLGARGARREHGGQHHGFVEFSAQARRSWLRPCEAVKRQPPTAWHLCDARLRRLTRPRPCPSNQVMGELGEWRDFATLSVKDLLEARDLYHFHLANRENVVGTAIGRYLIRSRDPWPEWW